ncbi:Brix-domain-containing protein [Jaminaea rosea]|uniref:Brix-domain-containing protein n=1 Tax=Jaminaea rosea TaxID=1569628 RepID=A0A316UZ14_9BASI|nr:Brix-domain-containing protein [Jaminaea rosea]PWN30452.1 Brix-domain-containing protein [Jaminaea rosea]
MDEAESSLGRGNFKHIGNKAKRQAEYRKYRAGKRKDKLARRVAQAKEEKGADGQEKKRARLAENRTRTIENTRLENPTIISEPNSHPGLKPSQAVIDAQQQASGSSKPKDKTDDEDGDDGDDAEEEVDEAALAAEEERAFEDASAPPAILITTSAPSSSTSPHLASVNARSHPAERTRDFIEELLNMFPGGEYRPRAKAKGASLGKIAGWARKRGYNAMIVIGEDHKQPTMWTLIGLPEGPTAVFRLTSVRLGKEIGGHARSTPHSPELILNNFTTALGHSVGSLLQSLFPSIPQLEGRQVLTAHNQRDFIFFRRHRYEFALRKGEEKARLQEIGPQFTVKLRKLMPSLPKGAGGWDGVVDFDGDGSGAVMDMGGGGEAGAEAAEAAPKSKRARGQVEETTSEFTWKPKMGVSRRNFYL